MNNNSTNDAFAKTTEEFNEFNSKMKDPLVVGAMLHRLTIERENSNRLMMEISSKLDRLLMLEQKVNELQRIVETQKTTQTNFEPVINQTGIILAEIDQKIMEFIKQKDGKTCAVQIQQQFNYKGRNAASSRLHSLYEAGLLEKVQAGKTVYYLLKKNYA